MTTTWYCCIAICMLHGFCIHHATYLLHVPLHMTLCNPHPQAVGSAPFQLLFKVGTCLWLCLVMKIQSQQSSQTESEWQKPLPGLSGTECISGQLPYALHCEIHACHPPCSLTPSPPAMKLYGRAWQVKLYFSNMQATTVQWTAAIFFMC